MMSACSGGILAGGEGRRFGGADKGWVEFRGRGLVEWTLEALRPQVAEVLISANRNLDRYRSLGVEVLSDELVGAPAGPMAGLARLLEKACQPWLLCVPCDAVRLPADLAARFLETVATGDADLAVLHDGEREHPTVCLVRTTLAEDARHWFAHGGRALREWQARQRRVWLQGEPPLNLNTPESLAALELAL